jgi:hypothetical protein
MKSTVLCSKKFKYQLLFSLIFLLRLSLVGQTQQLFIQRSSISSFGSSVVKNQMYLHHSSGQSLGFTQSNSGSVITHEGIVQSLLHFDSQNHFRFQCFVYPNPNYGEFSIQTILERATNYAFTLHDSFGKVVYRSNLEGEIVNNIDVSKYVTPGVYMLRIMASNGLTEAIKIVII